MNYIFTKKHQYSKTCKDGKNRNFVLYFLNDILIFKQKIPFNENFEEGFDRRTAIINEYILNGKIFQKRYIHNACGSKPKKIRKVSFPLSKKRLIGLNIPKGLKIKLFTIPVVSDIIKNNDKPKPKRDKSEFLPPPPPKPKK